jgi:hypothetical protein
MHQSHKKFYLFIDESGDHGLSNLDQDFPVFLLCGLLSSSENHEFLNQSIDQLKVNFWGHTDIILHSRDIRKQEKDFKILIDKLTRESFLNNINNVLTTSKYRIIASAIQKEKYIEKYGFSNNDVYEKSLSFIIERTIFCLDEIQCKKYLEIIIEKRGKKEDNKLKSHLNDLLENGTGYVSSERLKEMNIKFEFRSKKQNINGLQVADLIAYPIARHVINSKKSNPAFDLIESKIYNKKGKIYGLKIFP